MVRHWGWIADVVARGAAPVIALVLTGIAGPVRAGDAMPVAYACEVSCDAADTAVAGMPLMHPGFHPAREDTTFRHASHKGIECIQCHGTAVTHGALKFERPAGCLACHHGAQQTVPCAACHTRSAAQTDPVAVAFDVSPRPRPITRTLAFSHTRHATLDCARCHAANDRRSVISTCTSCHADHHEPNRDCAACHRDAKVGHDRTAHDGCAACHSTDRFRVTVASRSLCLACHQEQRDHYAARDCASCHAIPLHAGTPAEGRP